MAPSPNPAGDPTVLSLSEVAALIRDHKISPVEVTQLCLERIRRLDPVLNSFITVTADLALEQARAAEAEIAHGHYRGPLHGVPIALKDILDTAGIRTTAASAVFENRVPTADAEVVRRLKAAGAIVLGKTNLHEFAYGGSGVISRFGPVRNPWNTAHITGGSSSGSAAAVAAGLSYAALGTDTSGSIRLPASCCGIVGFKPTYGRVSPRGVWPLALSYDHVGPMTRTVRDAAVVLNAVAGYDTEEIYSLDLPVADYAAALDQPAPKPRIGVARENFFADLDSEVAAAMDQALTVARRLAADARDLKLVVDDDRTVFLAESYAVHRELIVRAPDRYQPETLRRIRTGAAVTAGDYIARWQDLQRIRRHAAALFTDCDLIVTPTSPVPPSSFAEIEAHADRLRPHELLLLRNTRPFNILGLPTISVPCGFTRSGLPIGMQITGPPTADARVLQFAHAFEQARGFAAAVHAPG